MTFFCTKDVFASVRKPIQKESLPSLVASSICFPRAKWHSFHDHRNTSYVAKFTLGEMASKPSNSGPVPQGKTFAMPQAEQLRPKLIWDEQMGLAPEPVIYDKTSVLTLSWGADFDDLGVGTEVRRNTSVAVSRKADFQRSPSWERCSKTSTGLK